MTSILFNTLRLFDDAEYSLSLQIFLVHLKRMCTLLLIGECSRNVNLCSYGVNKVKLVNSSLLYPDFISTYSIIERRVLKSFMIGTLLFLLVLCFTDF